MNYEIVHIYFLIFYKSGRRNRELEYIQHTAQQHISPNKSELCSKSPSVNPSTINMMMLKMMLPVYLDFILTI